MNTHIGGLNASWCLSHLLLENTLCTDIKEKQTCFSSFSPSTDGAMIRLFDLFFIWTSKVGWNRYFVLHTY